MAIMLATALAACSQPQPPKETPTLKIGVLPIADTLPLHVADTEGIFAKQNVKVELVPFASAIERDTAMSTGQVDGLLNDLISVGLLNKDGENAKIVRTSMRAAPKMAQISILVGPNSPIKTPADLKGKEVAISRNTLIEYVTDQLLASSGLKQGDFKLTEVSKIPVRVEMLMKGQVAAATLPEPFTSLAVQQGARVLLDDKASQVGLSVITIRQGTVAKNPNAIKSFLAAYEEAVDKINASPEKYRALLVDRAKIPAAIKDTFAMPVYPNASVPKEAEVDQAIKWMVGKQLIGKPISYSKLVDPSLLPK